MLLTTGQAARETGYSIRTIKRWIVSGALKGEQGPGGHWRVDSDSLAGLRRNDKTRTMALDIIMRARA